MLVRSLSVLRRSLSTSSTHPSPGLSELVKQLSKYSSYDELLEYSQRPIEFYYPNRMIENFQSLNLVQTAADLHQQMLVRIAHAIYHFQSLPFLPAANPILLSIHERYLKLFEMFAQLSTIKTDEDEKKFFQLVHLFLKQTQSTIGRLAAGCQETQRYFKSYRVMKEFIDNVLHTRLMMRLLAENFLQLHKQHKNHNFKDRWCGAINMTFSPHETVQQCIEDVSSVCFEEYSVVPSIKIDNLIDKPFPYFPNVVEYILRELLKNSMRAIVEHHEVTLGSIQNVKRYFEEHRESPLCRVLITADPQDEHFTIAIKDQGGGISENEELIFRYMYTGHLKKPKNLEEDVDILGDVFKKMSHPPKQMYGYGFGLPICRLYSQLFAGSLTLRPVPRIGTDVYLRLGFIHTNSERVKF